MMQIRNYYISSKKYLFFSAFILLILTTFIFLAFTSKSYAVWSETSPMTYWPCNVAHIYRYNFTVGGPAGWYITTPGDGSWTYFNAGDGPVGWYTPNDPSGDVLWNQPGEYCSRTWFMGHPMDGGQSTVCAFQTCKKDESDNWICQGGFSLDDLRDSIVAGITDGWLTRPCFTDVDVSDWGNCERAGGLSFPYACVPPALPTDPACWCYQNEGIVFSDPPSSGNRIHTSLNECDIAGGMWVGAPWNACRIPQVLLMEINPWDPSANCGKGGEETCAAVYWLQRGPMGQLSHAAFGMTTLNIAHVPEAPSAFRISFNACDIRETYLPIFEWNYYHPSGYQQDAYQLRIATNSTFNTNPDGSPIFDPDPSVEFRFGGGPCDNCRNSFSWPTNTVNNSFNPNSNDFKLWLPGKWGSTIYWTVRVRDGQDNYWSNWSDVQSFQLPPNAYPYVDFDWEPFGVPPASKPSVPLGTEIQFDATTSEFFGMPGTEAVVWDFGGDADEDLTDIYRPVVVYHNPNPTGYTARLTITDPTVDLNQADPDISVSPNTSGDGGVMRCHLSRNPIRVIWQIPRYREVAPR